MDDVGEHIERFAGYLRLLKNEESIKPFLEGEAPEHSFEFSSIPLETLPQSPDPTPMARIAGSAPRLPGPDAAPSLVPNAVFTPGGAMQFWNGADKGSLPPLPFNTSPAQTFGAPDYDITIEYFVLGSQLVHVSQTNTLEDGDTVLEHSEAGRPGWANADGRLATFLESAELLEAPADLVNLRDKIANPEDFPEALQVVLDAQSDIAVEESWLTPLAVENEGIWVDGVLTDTAPERPEFTDRDRLADPELGADPEAVDPNGGASDPKTEGRNGLERPGMEAELGGNLALASASIRDVNDAGGTLVVMGDVHDLSMIWQTNRLSDLDEAHFAGPVAPLEAGTNLLSNFAHFQSDPSMIAAGLPSAAPIAPRWHVDVVEGDLVDFNMLIQHNEIRDGDLSVQHAVTGFQRFVLGNNESVASSDIVVLRDYYDAIFVGGDMLRANMIFQYNVVFDDDVMRVIGSGADGIAATLGGGNILWNEALIQRFGSDIFAPVTEGAEDFLDILKGREGTLEDPPDLPVPAGGGMPLRVLFVEGNYFDVNAISQTNEIYDADAALQFGVGQMSLATGGNVAASVAQIVDFRGQGNVAMVGGEHYDDEMMIQTNILAEDQDVRVVDAQTLASEVIAFLDPSLVTEPHEGDQFQFIPMEGEGDMLSGIMA
ncbi:MAG: hypothetical protein CMH88_14750 [Oceanibulbus sp.]|jgi:hypothetical protein|nr:hypothetical protein [Sulfitobacter sp.]